MSASREHPGLAQTFEASERQLMELQHAHRQVCQLCEVTEDFRRDCRMGVVLREAWWEAWKLLHEPSRWTHVEVVGPLRQPPANVGGSA